MFRRFLRSIKIYIRGTPRPTPIKEKTTQPKHSSNGLDPGCVASLSTVFPSAASSKRVEPHRPIQDPVASTSTTPLPPRQQPEKIKPVVSSDSQPPPPYVETPPPSAPSTSTNVPPFPARGMPDMGAEISNMVNNIVNNAMRLTENIVTNLPSDLTGAVGNTNGNAFAVSYNLNNDTASYTRGSQQGNGSSSYNCSTAGPSASGRSSQESSSADFDLGSGSSSAPKRGGHTFYQTQGPGYNKNVFVTTNGGCMANMGNTISILGEPQSTWNIGSPHISTDSGAGSLRVDVVNDTVVVNGREYPKKQGLGPLGRLTEIKSERVVVDGHTYYPEPKLV